MEFQNALWKNHGILFFEIVLHATFESFLRTLHTIGYFLSL